MKKTQLYVNGMEATPDHFKQAQAVLQRAGIYQKMGNFGPLLPNKLSRGYKHIETITLEGYEYMIIESEVMSFSFSSMSVSAPYTQREAWFQPVAPEEC